MSVEIQELGEDGETWIVTGVELAGEALQAVKDLLRTQIGDEYDDNVWESVLDDAIITERHDWFWGGPIREYENELLNRESTPVEEPFHGFYIQASAV